MGSEAEYKTSWKSKSTFTQKPWGSEIQWHAIGSVDGKCLKIKEGSRTSLKYYSLKDEVLFVYSGKILVIHGDELTIERPATHPYRESVLSPGEVVNIQSGCPYRIEAIEDSEVIEIGSRGGAIVPVMIEDDYDRVGNTPEIKTSIEEK